MAEDVAAGTAVAEREDAEEQRAKAKESKKDKKRQKEDEEVEHEVELITPFGKLELEFEPTPKKLNRDERRRQKREEEEAKARAKAEKKAAKRGIKQADVIAGSRGGRGGKLVLILLLIGIAVAAVGIAIWLFGSKPESETVPAEYLAEPALERGPEGFAGKLRYRIRRAIRSGKQASREAQLEQERRYEELTKQA